jgi:Holliday junction resolvase
MATTPEGKVKAKVKKILEKHGDRVYYAMPVAGLYGKAGVPDFLICFYGKFIAIECKAGRGKTTALQDKNLDQINTAGGIAIVVNEANLDTLPDLLETQLFGER